LINLILAEGERETGGEELTIKQLPLEFSREKARYTP